MAKPVERATTTATAMATTKKHTSVTPQERTIYRSYDRVRRLRIARLLGPIFCVLQVALLISVGVTILRGHIRPSQQLTTTIGVGLMLLVLVFYLVGTVGALRGHVRVAALCLLIGAAMIYTLPLFTYTYQNGVDAFAIAALIASATFLLLVSVLTASHWPLILVTLLANAHAAFVLLFFPFAPGLTSNIFTQPISLLSTVIIIQWGVAGVQIAAQQQSLRTLRELGDVRVAYERARQLDELKDQFISNVNHELRNPVMALQGYVQLLSISGETMTPEDRTLFLERATVAGDQLGELVTSILSARQFDRDAGDFTPEVVEVRPTLESAASLIDPREGNMVERELHMRIPDGLAIWGERVRLRRILTNLLSNAIKYSSPGAPVEVTGRMVSEEGPRAKRGERRVLRYVEIRVRDHGLGIPPEQAPLLFRKFVRLERDLASTVPGNGLGLYLCRTLAEAMGGSLTFESSGVPGEGTTFLLRLPPPSQQPLGPDVIPQPAGNPADNPAPVTLRV